MQYTHRHIYISHISMDDTEKHLEGVDAVIALIEKLRQR